MDDGEIYSRIPPIFLRNAHAISLWRENPMKASTLRFELELGIECQGPLQNILLLWFIQGIFKSCWEVQQLLLLPPTFQDWAWCWSCTMLKDTSPYREIVVPGNISSKIHKILIIVFLSSAPFKANTEKGDRILGRYRNNNTNLTPERLKFGKFSNLFHPLCGPAIY